MNMSEFLSVAEKGKGREDIIKLTLQYLQDKTGFHSVAVRLKDGEDYPYYTSLGFSGHFIKAENFLCKRDNEDNIVRDGNLNPCLECMCGRVIRGDISNDLAFITENKSFCSNNTTVLLASCSPEEKGDTRNRCNAEGYESVFLSPIPYNGENIGLIQLNDFKPDMITEDTIEFIEELAKALGHAFNKVFLKEKTLKEKKKILKDNIQQILDDIQRMK